MAFQMRVAVIPPNKRRDANGTVWVHSVSAYLHDRLVALPDGRSMSHGWGTSAVLFGLRTSPMVVVGAVMFCARRVV